MYKYKIYKRKLALVIPAHNEELVIAATIASAKRAGQPVRDIYVVDDASTDNTSQIASSLINPYNVIKVAHSGKAGAIKKAVEFYNLTARYDWIHIADADGVFGPTYFKVFRQKLNKKYAAACGHVQSLPGGWISKYRTFEYTIGLEIMRRLQAWLGTITVIPGPTSCFRSDIFNRLDFDHSSLTEDFDLTVQVHRKKLGKIAYFPQAKSFTQDPKDFTDFKNQVARWYRGFWQGLQKHSLAMRLQKIDAYMFFLLAETIVFTVELFLVLLWAALSQNGATALANYVIFDIGLMFGWTAFAAALNNRWDIFRAFPLFYVLRFTNLYLFYKSFFEVIVLGRFKTIKPGWETSGRRYRIQTR